MELELVTHIKRMDSMLFGVTLTELKRVAFGYAEANGIRSTTQSLKLENTRVTTSWVATNMQFLAQEHLTREPSTPSLTY